MVKLKDILNEDFGDVAFGDIAFRNKDIPKYSKDITNYQLMNILKMQGVDSIEPNTEEESDLLIHIIKWLSVSNMSVATSIFSHRDMIEKYVDKFPTILKPTTPIGTEIYRGLEEVPTYISDYLEQLDLNDLELFDSGYDRFYRVDGNFKFKPHLPLQSWTTSFGVALQFVNDDYKVILCTKQDKNFFFNQEFLDIISRKHEEEIIHFGMEYEYPISILFLPNEDYDG